MTTRWLGATMFAGAIYFLVNFTSTALAGSAESHRMLLLWRWGALVVSALTFAAHLAHERVRLRNAPRSTAWHTSLAVAMGAFGLALAANVHDLASASGYRPRMLVALPAWALLTGVPAFVVAWVVAAALGAKRPRA